MVELFTRNPFALLELSPGATNQEIERQGKKILGMLELKIQEGGHYSTPYSIEKRDASDVRQAMAELRTPARYHFHSFWFLERTSDSPGSSVVTARREKKHDFLTAASFGR